MGNNTIMDNILETSMVNGIEKNLKSALADVGAPVSRDTCLWQIPDLIRKTLIANTISGINLRGKGGIKIVPKTEGDVTTYSISTSINSFKLNRPNYAKDNPYWGNDDIDVQVIFDDLFENILPNVKGVLSGDITVTDSFGNDTKHWKNPSTEEIGLKSGLESHSKYMRLYLTSQSEPIFILLGPIGEEFTGGYKLKSSDTVKINIDNKTNEITAHVDAISEELIKELYKD